MNKRRVNKRAYIAPQLWTYDLDEECPLLRTSFPGDHKPGNPGGQTGDAKHNDFLDDEDWDEEEDNNDTQTGLQW